MATETLVGFLRRDFVSRSWAGKLGYFIGIALFVFSGIGIDGAIPHHNWISLLAVFVIVCSGQWRKKQNRPQADPL